jgi:hypothetical protein
MNVHFLRPISSLPQQPAFHFRLLDSDTWHEGQVEELSEESLVFLADLPLEIGTYFEVSLPEALVAEAAFEPPTSYARVVHRVLDRWPDLRTAIAAGFVPAPAERISGAA